MTEEIGALNGRKIGGSFDAAARPIITIDAAKYQEYLDDSGLSDEQKEEFLQTLWTIIVSFVELGFGVHPLQEVCGKDSLGAAPRVKPAFDQVRSSKPEKVKTLIDSGPSGGLEAE